MPAEWHGTRANNGIERYAQSLFQVVKAGQTGLEDQFSPHDPIVQGWVAAGQEDPLGWQVAAPEILLHDKVAVEEVLHVFDEGDNPHLLGEELPYPILDQPVAQQGMGLLPHNDAAVVGLHQRQFLRRGGEGKNYFLDGCGFVVPVPVEVPGHIARRGDTLERFHHGLAHVPLNARVGHPQREHHVSAQATLFLEKLGVAGQQLADHLVVRLLALRVPHLLVAAQRKNVGGLLHFPVAPDDAGLVGKGRRSSVVRVLGAHNLGYEKHGQPRMRSKK